MLYTTVRRWFGPLAGLIAGAIVALTPVATLMFRFDNPDALLVLLITLAGYATTRAIESGRTRWLVLAGAFVGPRPPAAGTLPMVNVAWLVQPEGLLPRSPSTNAKTPEPANMPMTKSSSQGRAQSHAAEYVIVRG